MKKIKSFTYLDNYKMYSISSQIFEGLTEYVVASKTSNSREVDQQFGQKRSGHVMADIITESSSQSEKKFLHDYAYTLFENALIEQNKVLEIDINNINETIHLIDEFSFVKIKGRVIFNDVMTVENTISEFNDLGFWFGFVSKYYEHKEQLDKIQELLKTSKSQKPNQTPNPKQRPLGDFRSEAKRIIDFGGLQQNDEFLKGLAYILKYGYNGVFEVQVPFTDNNIGLHYLFSSIVNREYLKEKEVNIIAKYARDTEKEFVIFGVPTQTQFAKDKLSAYGKDMLDENDSNPMKEVIMDMVDRFGGIERSFTGKLPYEYLIDPIAIYREL